MTHSVLFYETERGRQPVRKYLDRVSRSVGTRELATIQRHIDLLVEFGDGLPSFGKVAKPLAATSGIIQMSVGDHRIAYAFHDHAFVLLHAWRKRSQRSRREIAQSERALADWRSRYPDSS